MINKLDFNLESFCEVCLKSSNKAYEKLKIILSWLEEPSTQSEARIILNQIEELMVEENNEKNYNFTINTLAINNQENQDCKIILLQLPSIFTPEDWSFTFFEGLLRVSEDEFYHRNLAELGCGNGWITLALAMRCSPNMIYGFDINPRAIVCAKINLYLNAMNKFGEFIRDSEGKTLLDRVQFHVSDLLGYCLENKIYLDKVIGCIPQVLSPNLNIINNIVPESSSDEALYALSNYCAKQGYVEDQFGLGLIARAVEESIQVLKSNGKIILNLGGRPGQAVLNRLFTRRGFSTKYIWQTKIQQAADTEILPLVDIENNSTHRFEFFMSHHSKDPISARTAYAYGCAGGNIFHSLNVIEAEIKVVSKMKNILELLKKEEYSNALSALDLTYCDHALLQEKVSFLSRIAEKFKVQECFPYEGVKGLHSFRRRIAEFFRVYSKTSLTAKNIFVAPNRTELIKNYINIYNVKKVFLDHDLCKNIPYEVIEIPKNCNSICQLIEKLKPDLVICSLLLNEIENQDSFLRLIELTQKKNIKLILDFSEHFCLSSVQKSNGINEYLSQNLLPKHVTIMCDLIYNKIYKDMDIAFIITENMTELTHLEKAAELTYSRPFSIVQEYYDTILYDLVNFHMKNDGRDKNYISRKLNTKENENLLKLSNYAKNSFDDASLESSDLELNRNTIRLDYGENSLFSPVQLKSYLMESFVRQNISDNEIKIESNLCEYLNVKFSNNFKENFSVIGNGVAPLFSSIMKYCSSNNLTVLLPKGVYGYFAAAAKFFGTELLKIDTKEEEFFKYNDIDLENYFNHNKNKFYCLFLNAPIINPTGQIYTQDEFEKIIKVCEKYNVLVIIDTIFSGLEFKSIKNLKLRAFNFSNSVLLGGFSKEFAAGGIRFGYAYTENLKLHHYLQKDNTILIPRTLKYTISKMLNLYIDKDLKLFSHLKMQADLLNNRSQILTTTLETYGWKPLECVGGLFLVAKPIHLIGKKVKLPDSQEGVEITYENIHVLLYKSTNLLINGAQWCGLDGYCRFVLSVKEEEFKLACEKIKAFYELIINYR